MFRMRAAIGTLSTRTIICSVSAGIVAAIATAAVVGISTDVISNPWFARKVPVQTFDWLVLIAISLLTGSLVVTFVLSRTSLVGARTGVGSGVLGWFAVSCPLCNKIVLALLGTSGATTLFEPIQPVLGAIAVLLATGALAIRIRMLVTLGASCPVPASHAVASAKPDS
jgi:hypothetical protein